MMLYSGQAQAVPPVMAVGLVQVMEWTQQMLAIGESFSSAESATLRDALARQSGKFFEAFHAGNMQVGDAHCPAQSPAAEADAVHRKPAKQTGVQ